MSGEVCNRCWMREDARGCAKVRENTQVRPIDVLTWLLVSGVCLLMAGL